MKKRNICLLRKSKDNKVYPLTKEEFLRLICTEEISEIIKQLSTLEKGSKEYDKLKDSLPMYIAMALCPPDSWRPKGERHNIEKSGLCVSDFDLMNGDVRKYFEEKVLPLNGDKFELAMAEISCGGHGMHLVTVLPKGTTIQAHQKQVAHAIGLPLKLDPRVHDPTRAIYMVSKDYILYLNDDLMFNHTSPEEGDLFGNIDDMAVTTPEAEAPTAETVPQTEAQVAPAEPTPYYNTGVEPHFPSSCFTVMPSYDGIPLNLFIDEVIKRYCTNGQLTEDGHQRDDLCFHTALLLRPMVNSNFNVMVQLLKDKMAAVGFQDCIVRQKVQSAISRNSIYSKTPSPEALNIISDLKRRREVVPDISVRHAPKMPKLVEDIAKLFTPELRDFIILCCLPCFAHALDGVLVNYRGRVKKLQFSVHILGEASCGKSYIVELVDLLMKQFKEEDKETLEKENADAQKRKRNRQKQDAEVEYHNYRKHILECSISKPCCYSRIHNAQGHSMFLWTEEIKEFDASMKTGNGGFSFVLLKAYDWGELSKATMTDDAPNMADPVCINSLTAGTPQASMSFLGNNSDGLAGRIIPLIMEYHRGQDNGQPLKPSKALAERIDKFVTNFRAIGDGEFKLYEFPALAKAIGDWFSGPGGVYDQWKENQDNQWHDIARRAGELAFRAGVVFWFLAGQPAGMCKRNGKPSQKIQEIIDAALWVADYVRTAQYTLFASQMEENNKAVAITVRTGKNKTLFSDLPEVFTVQDFMNLKIQNGEHPTEKAAYKTFDRWKADGYIEKQDYTHYKKLRPSIISA